jgi:pimeloyl-ACP methyl ester carboxylesterase
MLAKPNEHGLGGVPVLEVGGLSLGREVRPLETMLLTMKTLRTKARSERRTLVVSWFNRSHVLAALLFALVLWGHAVGQSTFTLTNNNSFVHPPELKENFISVDNVSVRYVESGSGPNVVMIHGNAGSVEDFEFGAFDILSSNYHVIAVDRPGHGRSERPKHKAAGVEYQTRLLHGVLSSIGVAQPVLIGHSWGAALALSYALQYPAEVSGLILIAPAVYPDAGESRLLNSLTKPPILGDVMLLAGKSLLGKQVLKTALERAFYPQPLPHRYFELVAASWLGRKQLKAYLADESSLNASLRSLSGRYSEIHTPVVIVTGDQDKIVSAKNNAYKLKDAIANSQLVTLQATGHEIPQSRPESIYTVLTLMKKPMAGGGDASQR